MKKRTDKDKLLASLSRMFRNGISDRAERFEVMLSEWSDLLYEMRQARQKQREKQGPVKSSQRGGWSL